MIIDVVVSMFRCTYYDEKMSPIQTEFSSSIIVICYAEACSFLNENKNSAFTFILKTSNVINIYFHKKIK